MTLVLCEAGDAAARWAAAELAARGAAVDVVTADDLGAAVRWEHRVAPGGAAVRVTLADGRELSSADPRPIFNRLPFAPVARLREVAGADFGYAVQELFALYLSALHAWPAKVVNRPTPQGLAGAYRHASVWRTLGARAGLPVRAWRQSGGAAPAAPDTAGGVEALAFVVEGTVILPTPLPQTLRGGCLALARSAGTELLGLEFAREGGGWAFVGASATPSLFPGGDELVAALRAALA